MIFSSFLFLWCFLPPLLLIYFSINSLKIKNLLLLIVSLIFYAWGEPIYVFLMMLSITLNYAFGLWIDTSPSEKKRKIALACGVLVNLGILAHFKYLNFAVDNLNILLSLEISAKEIPLPIGISFYTFQAISYLVDLYRKEVHAQRNILKMGLYIAFFPQLIAGPIVKYHDIEDQIDARTVTWTGFGYGVERFIFGFAKKILIANITGKVADTIFSLESSELSMPVAWVGLIAYTLQIYFDFSGYSDMAIGLGRMFGFTFQENFNYPYVSTSIKEFWQRWHISLATWFKQYLYFPLGGNRKGALRTYFNMLIVFFLTGLWHGAAWNFVAWGLWNGIFLVFERLVDIEKILRYKVLSYIYTMFVVLMGMMIFRTNGLKDAYFYFCHLIDFDNTDTAYLNILVTNEPRIALIAGVVCSGWGVLLWRKYKEYVLNIVPKYLHSSLYLELTKIVLFILSILALAGNSYNPFIYFRF